MGKCKIIDNVRKSNGALQLELNKTVHDHVVQVNESAIAEIQRLRFIVTSGRKELMLARLITADEIMSWPV